MKKKIVILMIILLIPAFLFSGEAERIISTASELVGTPYRYGGTSSSGFDCSGLLYYLYSDVVSPFPRRSVDQARAGSQVSRESLEPGDLIFYATGESRTAITHAALYVGQNTVIQAVSAGPQTGVVITDMDERYWKNRYVTARRVLAVPEAGSATEPAIVVAKEKVIDSKGKEKTVVFLGERRFTLSSWEEWYEREQEQLQQKKDDESTILEEDLSDFEKWKKANSPG